MKKMNFFSEEPSDNKGLIHYSGKIGEFDYDPQMFVILHDAIGDFLHYQGDGSFIILPNGVTSTRSMFYNCKLPANFTLGNHFNTSNVINMSYMFYGCKLPKNLSLDTRFIVEG